MNILRKEQKNLCNSTNENLINNISDTLYKSLSKIQNCSVHSGWFGASLYYCYLADYKNNDSFYDIAEACLDKAMLISSPENYKNIYRTDSYDYELAHTGLYFLFCKENGYLDLDISLILSSIEEQLLILGRSKISAGDFSQFSGALATAKFLIYKNDDSKNAILFFEALVEGLYKNAKKDKDGDLYWESPLLKNKVYLGISHGSAMIIAYLSKIIEKGIMVDYCKDLIYKAARFVLKHKREFNLGMFPVIIGDKEEPSQFSQCYGDLGVGYGLLKAGQILKDSYILNHAISILKNCCMRSFEDRCTHDASLTYGASGLAQFFNKISRTCSDEMINASENYWFNQIQFFSNKTTDFAGFTPMVKSIPPHEYLSYSWGIIGIGMSLMQYNESRMAKLDCFNIYI